MALFRNDSPGALTMEQAIERATQILEKEARRLEAVKKAKAEAAAREKSSQRMAEELAAKGRGGDTEIAHLTPGEMVVPRLFQTPEVMAALYKAAAAYDVSLNRLRVGHAQNSINPMTGAPEFGLSDWFKGWTKDLFGSGEGTPSPAAPRSSPSMASPVSGLSGIVRDNNAALENVIMVRENNAGLQNLIDLNNRHFSGTDPFTLGRVAPEHDRRTDVPFRPPPIPGSAAPPHFPEWPVPGHGALNERDPSRDQGSGDFGLSRFKNGKPAKHDGLDIRASEGTPVIAAADGIVVNIDPNPSETYGSQIVIDHGGGYYTQNAHLGSAMVKPGDKVAAGQMIGRVGRTGNVPPRADSHLHFEVRYGSHLPSSGGGTVIDPRLAVPRPYIPRQR
jgi:murein DD-endopeptidase MepM/ murein hydrolase activator NlpD